MKVITGFCDFCVPYNKDHERLLETLNELIEVGYKNVAIEQTVTLNTTKDEIPEPVNLKELREKTNLKIEMFQRLTVIYSDPSANFVMARSPNYKKFDIIAALPTTESAMQHSCQTFQGDLITYNDDIITKLSRKFYYVAIKRNIFFELKYSPAIVDSTNRKSTIRRGQQYHLAGKSKNIILSSGATNKFEVRSPNDVSNLGLIFGMSEEQARNSILGLGRKLLLSAECRRLGKSPVLMRLAESGESSSDLSEEDQESDDDKMSFEEEEDPTVSATSNKRLSKSKSLENQPKKIKKNSG